MSRARISPLSPVCGACAMEDDVADVCGSVKSRACACGDVCVCVCARVKNAMIALTTSALNTTSKGRVCSVMA